MEKENKSNKSTNSKKKNTSTKKPSTKKETTSKKALSKKSATVKAKSDIKEKPKVISAKKERKDYKKLIVIGIAILLIIIIIILLTNKKPTGPKLEIDYGKSKTISLSNIKKGKPYTKNIVIKNNSDQDLTYKISWVGIKNNFKEQNKLLYEVNSHDQDTAYLGKSQIPVADFELFDKVIIKKKSTQTYIFTVYFNGDEKKENKSTFKGILEIKQTHEKEK